MGVFGSSCSSCSSSGIGSSSGSGGSSRRRRSSSGSSSRNICGARGRSRCTMAKDSTQITYKHISLSCVKAIYILLTSTSLTHRRAVYILLTNTSQRLRCTSTHMAFKRISNTSLCVTNS